MRRLWILLAAVGLLGAALPAAAATGRVIKVLPQFLDLKGRNSVSPGLFERDSYQTFLRDHTNQCSGIRFAVQWKSKGAPAAPLKLQVQIHGVAHGNYPEQRVLELPVKPGGWFSRWSSLDLTGSDYKELGKVTAWRVTLWEGTKLIGEQKSFLW